jgi:hypothetical protein
MTFDGNPEPVQFIQPNVLDRAGFFVGKHDGLPINSDCAAPYSSKIFDAWRFTDGMLVHVNRAACAVQSGSMATRVPTLSRWND